MGGPGVTRARGETPENPLVPHASLRAIYTRMLEARLLEQHLGTRAADALRGEEACRASAVACLEPGDLVSDASRSPAADLLLGKPLGSLTQQSSATRSTSSPIKRLPVDPDAQEQLHTALGAAHALKLAGAGRLVLHYAAAGALSDAAWKAALAQAGSRELPILFVTLPPRARASARRPEGMLSDRAQGWGVPGVPVEAADAVALFRVLRESASRARAGDGPVLIECITWRPAGAPVRRPTDPLAATKAAVLARGAATERWLERTTASFAGRLAKLTR